MKSKKKIVLAYSGGLDTSCILHWLAAKYDAEIVAFAADVGQGEELRGLEAKALATGASKLVVRDVRDRFVRDYVFAALRANAVYEGEYLLGTSLARPCIAEAMMEVAREERATAIAHGATGKGNDQVRFELGAYHFDPNIEIIAPWREWELRGRADCIEYAKRFSIPITATVDKPYSTDRNIFHVSYEGGVLEDPSREPDPSMFLLTRDPTRAPDDPRTVTIDFERGDPVALDGVGLAPVELLERLNAIAGEHGVGRVDIVENRFVGMKSRGVYETPGGTVLHKARRAVESLTLDREVARLRSELAIEYASLVYRGFWFSPEREALQAFFDATSEPVTGAARVRLYKGSLTVIGRASERSLHRPGLATFEKENEYNQKDAEGFIRLNALRLRTRAR